MYTYVYIEVNLICIFVLLLIMYKGKSGMDKRAESIGFNRIAVTAICLHTFDIAWALVDGTEGTVFFVINNVANIMYMFSTGLMAWLWMEFVALRLHQQKNTSKLYRLMTDVPLAFLFLLCVASVWTKWLFYVDENNIYQRGEFHYIQVIIVLGYFIAATIHIFKHIKSENSYQGKKDIAALLYFSAPLPVGGFLSVFVYGLPTAGAFATLSLLIIYFDFQSYQISTDGLTGLNNRRQFDKHLSVVLTDEIRARRLHLIFLDINSFKHINDTLGHLEGDMALVAAANVLKRVCGRRECFLARYGGDEFAILYECNWESDISNLTHELHREFDAYNLSSGKEYTITVSIGVGKYNATVKKSASALIESADKDLYAAKKKLKAQK